MRNHQVTSVHPLLNYDGSLVEPGWSTTPLQIYNRDQIRANRFRIKEWDYYLVLNQDFGVAFTISNHGYLGLQSVSFLDFKKPEEHTETILDPLPLGTPSLPRTSKLGYTFYQNKRLQMSFDVTPGKRHLLCKFRNFYNNTKFQCDITLEETLEDSMVIATPFIEKNYGFYYNQKINCMRAHGSVLFNDKIYRFDPKTDFGLLDWGRGVWPYDCTWFWGSGSGLVHGKPFGFNIGYGFGDTTAATENILFYDGKAHKLDDVTFHIPYPDYESTWTFTSSDQRFNMSFQPIIDRKAYINALIIQSDQHQTFGRMSGTAILDDGQVLEIKDLLCSAEHIHNKF